MFLHCAIVKKSHISKFHFLRTAYNKAETNYKVAKNAEPDPDKLTEITSK